MSKPKDIKRVSVYLRGTVYQARWFINGKQYNKSLKTRDLSKALQMGVVLESKLRIQKETSALQQALSNLNTITAIETQHNPSWISLRWSRMNYKEKLSIIFFLFDGKCYYCGTEVNIPNGNRKDPCRAVMDHRIPVAGGGSDLANNIVLCCNTCNMKKLDRDPDEFLMAEKCKEATEFTLK